MELVKEDVLSELGVLDRRPLKKFYVSVLSNFSQAYDKYSNRYSKAQLDVTFSNKFFVLDREKLSIGINKNKKLLLKIGDPRDKVLVLETSINEKLYNDHATGVGHYIKRNYITVDACYIFESQVMQKFSIEETMAKSLSLQKLLPYKEVRPRSVSYLPIAQGCQASCSFCFSKASVSDSIKAFKESYKLLEQKLLAAKEAGAERAVITGGGEPTLLPSKKLNDVISLMSDYFEKTVLITNGFWLSNMNADKRESQLKDMSEAGLSILAISRHHYDDEFNSKIMNLKFSLNEVFNSLKHLKSQISPRLICVLQKGGVENEEGIRNYINYAAENGVTQVCFKELYVSTSSESYYHRYESNIWSRENQVSLSLLTNYLEKVGAKILYRLPWGAPIYGLVVNGTQMKIAAYTEPSLFWERTSGIARSWNIMSDGEVLASLEDKGSRVFK